MRILKRVSYSLIGVLLVLCGLVFYFSVQTENDIKTLRGRVATLASSHPSQEYDKSRIAELPKPVQRYFAFVFPSEVPTSRLVRLKAAGDFRRPRSEGFNPTTSEQVIAIGTPALMFSATTPILPGVTARVYDFFAQGQMEMKAKIMSILTIVDEKESPKLNQISLRRWLLESALYPVALLPGGSVTWEAIDDHRARAVVEADGLKAHMVAYFDGEGRMTHMTAEEDGDLDTPYHGSGEHVTRGGYKLTGKQMIPMSFQISRAAGGKIYPFWKGHITSISYE